MNLSLISHAEIEGCWDCVTQGKVLERSPSTPAFRILGVCLHDLGPCVLAVLVQMSQGWYPHLFVSGLVFEVGGENIMLRGTVKVTVAWDIV